MARYKFTGDAVESFPSIVIDAGEGDCQSLTLSPGDVVEIADEIDHPRLQPTKQAATDSLAPPAVQVDQGVAPAEPDAELLSPTGDTPPPVKRAARKRKPEPDPTPPAGDTPES